MVAKTLGIDDSRSGRKIIEQLEQAFNDQSLMFKTIFKHAPVGIVLSAGDSYIGGESFPMINAMYEQITGRTKKELMSIGWEEITHPEDLERELEYYTKLQRAEINDYVMEKRFIKPDGSMVWVKLMVARLSRNQDSKSIYLCLAEDISDRKTVESALLESERSKSVLLSNLPGMAYRCNYDQEWTMQFISEGCYELTGYRPESLISNKELSFNDLIVPEYRDNLWYELHQILDQKKRFKKKYEIITAAGHRKWVLEIGQGIDDEQGRVRAIEGIIIDITDIKEQEIKLEYISEHDTLTGLYNRRYFEALLAQDARDPAAGKRALVLLNLKRINSITLAYGYTFSENVMKELAVSLSTLTHDHRKLFQISFERFAFYIRGYKEKQELADFCDRVFQVISNIQFIHAIGCNIGILEIDAHSDNAEALLRNASIAAEGKDNRPDFDYCFFEAELKEKVTRETEIKDELINAAYDENNESLFLQYQPVLDLKSDKIKGFEALARFKSEKLGLVSPADFIPLAEETMLIVPIGQSVIRKACAFLKTLEKAGYQEVSVSVNISAIQFVREEFMDELMNLKLI